MRLKIPCILREGKVKELLIFKDIQPELSQTLTEPFSIQ